MEIDLVGELVMNGFRHIDAARSGQRPDPRRDVDTVAEDVAILDDNVAEIDPTRIAMRCSSGSVWFICAIASRSLDGAVELDEHQFGERLIP
jgi:hypothetical protein